MFFNVFSTPNRLVVYIEKIANSINKKSEEIRGPSTKAPDQAIEGFIRSNNIKKNQIYKKTTDKGDFYFYKNPSKRISTIELIKENIPNILNKNTTKPVFISSSINTNKIIINKIIIIFIDAKKRFFE